MNFDFDNHIHTVYSGRADSTMTVSNIIKRSEQTGLRQIAIIEHSFECLALAAKQYNVAFEINEILLSNMPTEKLQNSYSNVVNIMLKHEVKLSISSDAHTLDKIGKFSKVSEFIKPFNISINNFLTITNGGKYGNVNK